jgi:Mg-chelatase subunit ChlI
MVPRWVVVDKLVHELGALRAVVQEVEARPELAGDDMTFELRSSLARAADTIHLVIGGNEGMLAQAWRSIAEAQEVGVRARLALEGSRATNAHARAIRDSAKAHGRHTESHIDDLRAMREASEARRTSKKEPSPQS